MSDQKQQKVGVTGHNDSESTDLKKEQPLKTKGSNREKLLSMMSKHEEASVYALSQAVNRTSAQTKILSLAVLLLSVLVAYAIFFNPPIIKVLAQDERGRFFEILAKENPPPSISDAIEFASRVILEARTISHYNLESQLADIRPDWYQETYNVFINNLRTSGEYEKIKAGSVQVTTFTKNPRIISSNDKRYEFTAVIRKSMTGVSNENNEYVVDLHVVTVGRHIHPSGLLIAYYSEEEI